MCKYYTPTTQEEVITFVTENKFIWSDSINLETKDYIPITFTANLPTSLHYMLQMFNIVKHSNGEVEFDFIPDNFRIKYLDREDIESLGFEFSYTYEGIDTYTKLRQDSKEPYWEDDYYYIHFNVDDKWLEVDNDQSYDDLVTYFQGTIKNKSELKKLLKQLGINE